MEPYIAVLIERVYFFFPAERAHTSFFLKICFFDILLEGLLINAVTAACVARFFYRQEPRASTAHVKPDDIDFRFVRVAAWCFSDEYIRKFIRRGRKKELRDSGDDESSLTNEKERKNFAYCELKFKKKKMKLYLFIWCLSFYGYMVGIYTIILKKFRKYETPMVKKKNFVMVKLLIRKKKKVIQFFTAASELLINFFIKRLTITSNECGNF